MPFESSFHPFNASVKEMVLCSGSSEGAENLHSMNQDEEGLG